MQTLQRRACAPCVPSRPSGDRRRRHVAASCIKRPRCVSHRNMTPPSQIIEHQTPMARAMAGQFNGGQRAIPQGVSPFAEERGIRPRGDGGGVFNEARAGRKIRRNQRRQEAATDRRKSAAAPNLIQACAHAAQGGVGTGRCSSNMISVKAQQHGVAHRRRVEAARMPPARRILSCVARDRRCPPVQPLRQGPLGRDEHRIMAGVEQDRSLKRMFDEDGGRREIDRPPCSVPNGGTLQMEALTSNQGRRPDLTHHRRRLAREFTKPRKMRRHAWRKILIGHRF